LPGRLWADALATLTSKSKALATPTVIFTESSVLVKALWRAKGEGSEDTRWFVA
jgi:hypothetical protein